MIPVAVKALKDEPSKEQKDEFFREVTLMSILTHPNIVQLLAVSTEEEPYGMLFEFMSGGDLNQYLRNALPAETSLDSSEKAKGIYTLKNNFVQSICLVRHQNHKSTLRIAHASLIESSVLPPWARFYTPV